MAIVQTGSVLTFPALGSGNTGTVSTTITVPSDAELVVVGWSGASTTANFYASGSMTFTKGGVDTAMTMVAGGSTSNWSGGMAYLNLPDTGSNKTLKWDWSGAGAASDTAALATVTFWKGNDTSSAARGTNFGTAGGVPVTTGTITAASGDLIVGWIGAFASPNGNTTTLTNCTLLSEITASGVADAAWVTASPSGNQTIGCSVAANWGDLTMWGASFKVAASGGVSVNITGVSATAAVGTPTVTGFGNVTLTGVNSTAAVGTLTASLPITATLTGVAATAAVGTPTVTGIGNVTLSGVNATAAAGTLSITGFASVTLTGVLATAAVNVPTITAAANIFPTGVVATTAVNIPTVSGKANVTLSGVNATGTAGDVTVSVGGAISVTLTGVNATAAVGAPTITGFANVSITGIAATAQIGTLTTSAASNVSVTGVAATSAVNTPTVTGFANVTLSGVLATVAAGNITVSVPAAVSVTLNGVSASAQVGTLSTNFDIDSSTRGTETVLTDHKRGVGSYLSRKRWLELREQFKAEDEAKVTKSKKVRLAVQYVKADIAEAIDAGIVQESRGPLLASLTASAESAAREAEAMQNVAKLRAELKAIHELDDDDEILGMAMKQFPDFFFGGRF